MKHLIFLIIISSLTSCSRKPLDVSTQYWSRKDLASVIIDTPDPAKNHPKFGQKILISWSVSKKILSQGPLELDLKVNLKNNERIYRKVLLKKRSGTYQFEIYGDDFTKKGGLLSYFVELQSNGKPINTKRHKLWVEPITIA
jgi:hypothetical protein